MSNTRVDKSKHVIHPLADDLMKGKLDSKKLESKPVEKPAKKPGLFARIKEKLEPSKVKKEREETLRQLM